MILSVPRTCLIVYNVVIPSFGLSILHAFWTVHNKSPNLLSHKVRTHIMQYHAIYYILVSTSFGEGVWGRYDWSNEHITCLTGLFDHCRWYLLMESQLQGTMRHSADPPKLSCACHRVWKRRAWSSQDERHRCGPSNVVIFYDLMTWIKTN